MAVAGLALDGERRLVYLRATGAVALTLAANTLVKALVRRARPALRTCRRSRR